MNQRSFHSARGGASGKHAHGFLMGSRLVENDQNAWYNNDTPKKKNSERTILTHEKQKKLLYSLANICTTTMREQQGGSLVAPPKDPVHIQRYLGDLKGFETVDELLVTITTGRVPVDAAATGVDLECALQYGKPPQCH